MAKSGLTRFDAFRSLLDTWLNLIADYCINRQSSGFGEGLNNKFKVVKRLSTTQTLRVGVSIALEYSTTPTRHPKGFSVENTLSVL